MIPEDARLLRLYLNNDDRYRGRPLYEAVVARARELGLAGASVFAAEMGYGIHRVIHDNQSEYTFIGAPVVVEVVDGEERIQRFLAEFQAMIGQGLVTISTVSPVKVVHYVHVAP